MTARLGAGFAKWMTQATRSTQQASGKSDRIGWGVFFEKTDKK